MLALTLALTVLAAPPRGLPAAHSVELTTQVDTRLPKWLTGEGDLKALWANPKELEAHFLSLGVKKADVGAMVASAVKEQADKAGLAQFAGTRAFIEYAGKVATLHAFDDEGHRCEVSLLAVGTEAAQRYVVLGGPRTDDKSFEAVAEDLRQGKEMVVFLEKKGGAWSTGAVPPRPPPDCTGVLKNALKVIFTAEKAYFAEKDAYSNSLSKVGVDVKTLGITSAKVSVAGAAPRQTFTIQVGLKGGLMTMDDKGTVLTVADCP
ncbi:MAG: hypothetical protein Q8L48_10320 [Archangium sp.]|nr:hypothetical protein [Archangium sp.]